MTNGMLPSAPTACTLRARAPTHTHTYSWEPGTLQTHEANIITWKCWQTRRESKNSYYSWLQEETFFKHGIKQRADEEGEVISVCTKRMCGGSSWNKTNSRRLCLMLPPVVMSAVCTFATCILCFPWQSNPQWHGVCSGTIFSTRNCKLPDSPATLGCSEAYPHKAGLKFLDVQALPCNPILLRIIKYIKESPGFNFLAKMRVHLSIYLSSYEAR